MGGIVDRWNTAYFDNRLSPGAVVALNGLIEASTDAQALVDRVFRLMRVARFDPADLTSLTGYGAPRVLPSAWNGAVPPITMTGRHHKLDDYIARNPWHRPRDGPVLVDLGCGFPPFTAVDSAAKLTGWQSSGLSLRSAATSSTTTEAITHASTTRSNCATTKTSKVVPDSAAAQAHFRRLLHQLLPLMAGDDAGELVKLNTTEHA